jgi:hypothetical protein
MTDLSSPPQKGIAPLVAYFENLAPDNLAQIDQYYATQARFKDPFNDVTGLLEIRRIFEHMFVALVEPRFVVTAQICQGSQCFLTWEFRFQFRGFHKGREQVILGASHLILDEQGLVTLHRDYWDAAEELYEKLPWVGAPMRWLKRRANS